MSTTRTSRALVIEDTPEYVELVRAALEPDGIEIVVACSGEDGVELARTADPDVVVLDVVLPGIDGLETCRQIRAFSDAYVIMLTTRAEEVDRVLGLTIGADDYLAKPFSPRELSARISAMLRRPRAPVGTAAASRTFGDLLVDPGAREVRVAGTPVELSFIEFQILDALSEVPRLTLSRGQLIERVWGPGWFGDDHVIDVHVSNLRKKLGDDPRSGRYVRTVRGFGYRMGTGAPTG